MACVYPALLSEAAASTPDPLIDTCPPTLLETYAAANKVKAGKAPGSCGVYPEYILHGGNEALTRSRAVARIADRTATQPHWVSLGPFRKLVTPAYFIVSDFAFTPANKIYNFN